MTPNDALTQLQRSHRQSQHGSGVTSPSLRRRLTRSPSPAISFDSRSNKQTYTSSYSSDSDSSIKPMSKRRYKNGSASGSSHPNGIAHVPEETSDAEVLESRKSKRISTPKIDWEIPRKTLHSSIGFLTLFLYISSFPLRPVIQALSISLFLATCTEFLRFRFPLFESCYEKCFNFLMRECEKKQTNGVFWYLCGVTFVLVVYPVDVAVISILILSWADTAASTIGRLYGSRTPKLPSALLSLPIPFVDSSRWPRLGFAARKSTAGFLASALTGFLITTSFWGYFAKFGQYGGEPTWSCVDQAQTGSLLRLLGIGLASGLVTGVTEALDLGSWDDNITLPIMSGAAIWGIAKVFR